MADFLSRTRQLVGEEAVNRLQASKVALFGLGGVGSYTAEALARAGIGRFLLVDADTVELSNINRQLYALHSTLGKAKVELAAERIRSINPQAEIETRQLFFLPENADEFDLAGVDFIADAIDTVAAKVELAVRAQALGTPLASCMGTGNKLDPTRFEVADIFSTSVCPLCKIMRKLLKERNVKKLTVIYSKEVPLPPLPGTPPGKRPPASISYVPPVAGFILAGVIIRALGGISTPAPR